MTNLSSFILMAILAVGLTYFYKNYYFDEEYKKVFGVISATFIIVKTKIFKSKDGALVSLDVILEDNKHKKDFEVNY